MHFRKLKIIAMKLTRFSSSIFCMQYGSTVLNKKIYRLKFSPNLNGIMSRTSFWPNCTCSSVWKLILAWLRHQTCFHLSTETRVSLPFLDCNTLVLLTRVMHVRMFWKHEEVTYDISFYRYSVFTSKMVETSDYPSHFILSKTEFQQQPSTSRDHNSHTVAPMRMD
jgi:hypothetical protein